MLQVCVAQEKITKNVEREILNHYSLIHVRPLCEAECTIIKSADASHKSCTERRLNAGVSCSRTLCASRSAS